VDPNANVATKDDGPPFATGLTGNRGRNHRDSSPTALI
jgi:hypothetical protein